MRNFQSIIAILRTQTCKDIFRSALVHIIEQVKPFVNHIV